jgi:phenylacetate-CoA ligase
MARVHARGAVSAAVDAAAPGFAVGILFRLLCRSSGGAAETGGAVIATLADRLRWTAFLAWHWRGQSRFAFQSRSVIDSVMRRRLARMVRHAYDTVPYYKETMRRLGVLPGDFRSAHDLGRLPVIERDQLQKDPEYFLSDAIAPHNLLRTRTGGSSGAPRTVWWDAGGILENAAHAERERAIIAGLVGTFVNYRETVIGSPLSSDLDIQAIYRDRLFIPSRARTRYQHLSILDSPAKNIAHMNEFRPDVIRTYGSYLGRLFSYAREAGVEFLVPKVVFYDADELPESARQLISGTFGVPVLSAYQAGEAFKIGFECEEHGGFHLNCDVYPLRIVDVNGDAVPDGESGDVLVSNLVNRATVLLNYRLGDVAHVIPGPCRCGRTLPVLSFVEGRIDDWIGLPSGELVHPQAVRTIMVLEQSITQYQVIQNDFHRFSLAVVGGRDHDALVERLRASFAERFGSETAIEVSFVDAIPPTASGKINPVQSRVARAVT